MLSHFCGLRQFHANKFRPKRKHRWFDSTLQVFQRNLQGPWFYSTFPISCYKNHPSPGWNPRPAHRDRGRVASSSWPGQVFPVLRRCSPWPLGNPRGHGWCIPSTGHGTTVPNLDPEIEEKMPIATWRDVFYLSVSIYIYLDLSMSIYIYLAYWRAWVYHLIIPMLSKIIFPSQNCSQHPIDPYIYIYIIYTSPFQAENCVNREVEATNSIQFSPTWLPAASKSLGAHLSLGSGAG